GDDLAQGGLAPLRLAVAVRVRRGSCEDFRPGQAELRDDIVSRAPPRATDHQELAVLDGQIQTWLVVIVGGAVGVIIAAALRIAAELVEHATQLHFWRVKVDFAPHSYYHSISSNGVLVG